MKLFVVLIFVFIGYYFFVFKNDNDHFKKIPRHVKLLPYRVKRLSRKLRKQKHIQNTKPTIMDESDDLESVKEFLDKKEK